MGLCIAGLLVVSVVINGVLASSGECFLAGGGHTDTSSTPVRQGQRSKTLASLPQSGVLPQFLFYGSATPIPKHQGRPSSRVPVPFLD